MTALDLGLIRQTTGTGGNTSRGRTSTFSSDRMTSLQLAKRTVIFTFDAAGIAGERDFRGGVVRVLQCAEQRTGGFIQMSAHAPPQVAGHLQAACESPAAASIAAEPSSA
jgi:hypothetical protein